MPDYTTSTDIDNFMQSSDATEARSKLGLGSASTSETADFADANHTHVSSDITDFEASVEANSQVTANTTERHNHANKATLDATEESYTTADKAKVDSALQSGDNVSDLSNDAGYLTTALQASDIDTLAELNSILTDANLDDATSSRTPTAHSHPLSDLTQSSATDGQVPVWSNSANQWQPQDNTGATVTPLTAETSVWVDAGALLPDAYAEASSKTGTNGSVDVVLMANTEKVYAKWTPPPQWDRGNISIDVYWSATGATAGHKVNWNIAAQAGGNNDPWDEVFPSPTSTGDDEVIASGDIHIISASGITVGGLPANGDVVFFEVERTASGATQMSEEAELLGFKVNYENTIIQNWYITKLGNEADDASGTGEKTAWVAPASGKIHAVHSGCSTATSGGSLTVDVQKNATTIVSTMGVIDDTETSTSTGTNAVLTTSPTSFVAGDRISFLINSFGGSGAKGLHTDLLISWE